MSPQVPFKGTVSELLDLVLDTLLLGNVEQAMRNKKGKHYEKTNGGIIQPPSAPWLQATPIGGALYLC